jgi:copper chaperone CopZ
MKSLKILSLGLALLLGTATLNAANKADEAVVNFKTDILSMHCKMRVEKVIPFEKGVVDMDIHIQDGSVLVKYKPAKTSVEAIQKAIEKMGYTVSVVPTAKEEKKGK